VLSRASSFRVEHGTLTACDAPALLEDAKPVDQ
jgi:hypothetical protein